eukprot:9003663-Heterocapsa_arctica.AAC.1
MDHVRVQGGWLHDEFYEVADKFDFLIVRNRLGQQIQADGGEQLKFDDAMRGPRRKGIRVWLSPNVAEKMGAKDAICQIVYLYLGL